MTTATTEANTVPQVRLNQHLAAGLREGASFPYVPNPPGEGPAGYSGCLLLPLSGTAGWEITEAHPAGIRAYRGTHRGWWVRERDITLTGIDTDVPIHHPEAVDDLVPEEHRGQVPAGAFWVRTTQSIDGLPQMDQCLAIDDPRGGSRGPLLMFWPGHLHFDRTASDRPSLPDGWHGWWAHRHIERLADYVTPDAPTEIVPRTRVRVTRDLDRPAAEGQFGTVVEVRPGERLPYRVVYDSRDPGGDYGWWVREVVAEQDDPLTERRAQYPVGHWYSWGTKTDWFRVSEVTADAVSFDRMWTFGFDGIRERTRRYINEELGRHDEAVCLPPGDPDMPAEMRRLTAERFSEGVRVMLTSRHVMFPDDTATHADAPHGIGSTAVILERTEAYPDSWLVRWDVPTGEGVSSFAHESCLTPLVSDPPFAVGDEVVLIAPHVTSPGGMEFSESPEGIGSRARITDARPREGRWGVQWVDRDGREAVHSTVHECCIAHMPTVEEEPAPEPVTEPPFVPEGALRVRYRGTSRRITRDAEYMALGGGTGYRLILLWPGHPDFERVNGVVRAEVPDGWRSYRASLFTDLGPWVEPTPEEPTPVGHGWEGVPEEHWSQVPEGAHRVRYRLGGEVEHMAFQYATGGQTRWMLVAWPGHPSSEFMVHADHPDRLTVGVPPGWRSYAASSVDVLGPWPRTMSEEDRLRAELAEVQRRYDEDLRRIADIMKEEADRREWCAEYETVARRIDDAIHGTFDGQREIEYEVRFSGMVPFSGAIRLNLQPGLTEEQVRDAVREYFGNANSGFVENYATADWSEVDTSDLSVDEYDTED